MGGFAEGLADSVSEQALTNLIKQEVKQMMFKAENKKTSRTIKPWKSLSRCY